MLSYGVLKSLNKSEQVLNSLTILKICDAVISCLSTDLSALYKSKQG